MAGIFAKATSMLSSLPIDSVVGTCFGQFDKDKSGFVEGPEVAALANMVTSKLGVNVPQDKIDMVFAKVAGPDQKLDKEEFTALVKQLLDKHAADGGAVPAAAPAE